MIAVENGGKFEMKNPNIDMKDIEQIIEECKGQVLRAASPFINTIRFFNKTKRCNMFIGFSDGNVVVTVTNPDDERFDLNDPDPFTNDGELINATTPASGTIAGTPGR